MNSLVPFAAHTVGCIEQSCEGVKSLARGVEVSEDVIKRTWWRWEESEPWKCYAW